MHVAPVILMAFLASAAHGADFQRQRYQAHVVQTLSTSCQDKINGCLDGAYLAKTQDTSWDRECEAAMDIKDCCAENGACSIDEIETLYDAACEPLPAGNLRDKAVFDVSSSYIYNALLNDDCRTSMTTCFDVKNEDWSDFTYTSFPELCNRFRDNYKCLVTDGKCELYMFELYTSEICEDHYRNHLKQQRIVDTMRDFSEGCQGQMMECLPTQTEEEGPSSLWSPGTHCRIFKTLRSCIVANNVCTGGNYDVAENIVCATMKPDEVAAFRLRTELMFAYVISSESCQQSMQHCLGRDGNPWENADYTMTSSQFCSWFKSKIDCFADEEEG